MKYVAVVSGGMDSVTLAHHLNAQGHHLHLLSFDYGQRHIRELQCAAACAQRLNADHDIINLTSITAQLKGSALTDPSVEVPEGHYAAETMKATIVPNRNMMMLSIAAAVAIGMSADGVAMGVHAGDHPIYPDCRPEFFTAASVAVALGTGQQLDVCTPFIKLTKADIAKLGDDLGVPWHETWSCYVGEAQHCGRCGTCVERAEAFELAGVPDPTPYEGQ